MADVLFYEAQKNASQLIDFAIMNGEGVRIPVISKGPIIIGKTYELMPFENETAVLTLWACDERVVYVFGYCSAKLIILMLLMHVSFLRTNRLLKQRLLVPPLILLRCIG